MFDRDKLNLQIAFVSIVIFTTLISFNSRTWHIFLSVCFIFAIFHHTACLSAYMCFVCLGNFIPSYWRRKWQPTPVLLPGKSHGRRSLIGYSPWGPEESDMTERLHFHVSLSCIGGRKEVATHSSVLAWRIPGTGEPGGFPSMGSHRVRHG